MKSELFLFTLFFFSLPTLAACIDSDNGADAFVYGACATESFYGVDSCSGAALTEYACASGAACISSQVTCAQGCLYGACRALPPAPVEQCFLVKPASSLPQTQTQDVALAVGQEFGAFGYSFEVTDWSSSQLRCEDAAGSPVILVLGEAFAYQNNVTLTLEEIDDANAVVRLVSVPSSGYETCLVVWTPRNYSYAPGEASASFEVRYSQESAALPVTQFACNYSLDNVLQAGVALSAGTVFEDAFSAGYGPHSLGVECGKTGLYFSRAVQFTVLPVNTQTVYLAKPIAFAYASAAPWEIWLYGSQPAYSCELAVDSSWFPVAGALAPGKSYSGTLSAGTGTHEAQARCRPASVLGEWFYSEATAFSVSGSAPSITSPVNASLHWTQSVSLSFTVVQPANCSVYLDNTLKFAGLVDATKTVALTSIPFGVHDAVVSCNGANASVSFTVLANGQPFLSLPQNNSSFVGSPNASIPLSFVVNGSQQNYSCAYYLDGVSHSVGNASPGVPKSVQFNASTGNHFVNVSCGYGYSATRAFSVNASAPLVLPPAVYSPEPNEAYASGVLDLEFEASGTFAEYACYYKLDGNAWENASNASNAEPVLLEGFLAVEEGSHWLQVECRGLAGNVETVHSNSTTLAFEVGAVGLTVEEVEEIPALPSTPPLPAPPAESRLTVDCPGYSTRSNTLFTAFLLVDGAPACDSALLVTANKGGAVLASCDPSTGEHEISVESDEPGAYSIALESQAHGLKASCEFTRAGAKEEETPALPVAFALVAALVGFWASKRNE
ncbi:MAG: hypothetical protein WC607_01995 [Candidatus Micrarchaeia archaeon]